MVTCAVSRTKLAHGEIVSKDGQPPEKPEFALREFVNHIRPKGLGGQPADDSHHCRLSRTRPLPASPYPLKKGKIH